ncbi:MAG TPA: hypothetical protein VHS05_15900 [Pyrinomonadaceae bacterium]|jgi:hypothetical protein|nr:hypothetical protein [Pyrinomonadaceae bacterium]
MSKIKKGFLTAFALTAVMLLGAAATFAQTTGSVTMNATVSNFVELTSGGAVTLTGNSGGSIITDGTANSPLAVVVNLGELGPSNTNSFVELSVPLRLRSNVAYQLNMVSSVAGAGATSFSLKDTDVGFGLTPAARPASLAAGVDTNATPGDPTVGGSTDVNGRWVFAGANSTLGAYAVSGAVLSGPRINKTVAGNSATNLTVPAIFAIKPQFFDPAPAITITAQFTVVAL